MSEHHQGIRSVDFVSPSTVVILGPSVTAKVLALTGSRLYALRLLSFGRHADMTGDRQLALAEPNLTSSGLQGHPTQVALQIEVHATCP